MMPMRRAAHFLQLGGAGLLVGTYLEDVLITLNSMSVHRDEHGMWQVMVQTQAVPKIWSWIALIMMVGGILAFAGGFVFKRLASRIRVPRPSRLTLRDMLTAFGWVGLLFFGGLMLYYLGLGRLLPEGFRQSAGGSALGGVSMQIAAMIAIPLYYRKHLAEIGLKRPMFSWKMLGLILMFFTTMYALSLLTSSLGHWLGVNTDSYREQNISQELHAAYSSSWRMFLLPLLSTSLIAPIGEELLFRGVLQSTLSARYGALIGILVSAFLFALIHADLVLFLPIFVMGLLFGVLYRLTGSIWAPIWLHMLNNLFASLTDLM